MTALVLHALNLVLGLASIAVVGAVLFLVAVLLFGGPL